VITLIFVRYDITVLGSIDGKKSRASCSRGNICLFLNLASLSARLFLVAYAKTKPEHKDNKISVQTIIRQVGLVGKVSLWQKSHSQQHMRFLSLLHSPQQNTEHLSLQG
jgi:hypothetical protein